MMSSLRCSTSRLPYSPAAQARARGRTTHAPRRTAPGAQNLPRLNTYDSPAVPGKPLPPGWADNPGPRTARLYRLTARHAPSPPALGRRQVVARVLVDLQPVVRARDDRAEELLGV